MASSSSGGGAAFLALPAAAGAAAAAAAGAAPPPPPPPPPVFTRSLLPSAMTVSKSLPAISSITFFKQASSALALTLLRIFLTSSAEGLNTHRQGKKIW
eukprot:CAMPEP_0179409580 /NCGR_PEP_ID=MMETSP0799-20121207/2782_1 /TAXON_ID=46947 /ORGANISM="Geminigera cryophila, Strain CCMP2564" /LENGTH=98 /DNA_ID=CAMNT_0021181277 /DNA_START=61 /DNA_END=354 /DNA_ORIENTATION=-